ncbi:hypothetical protein FBQ97_18475 [Acidobacteria bacterium ACD]|nr:hypothetical protein [Acidobacteria bacterium ACD]
MGPEAKVVTGRLHRVQRGRRKRFESVPPPAPEQRPARVALQLALAHEVQRAIDRGELKDQADAPDIQESVLSLEAVDGMESLAERAMRPALRAGTWARQRELVNRQQHP